LHSAVQLLACLKLNHNHVIWRHTEFRAQDVRPQISVVAQSVCGYCLDPFFIARFAAWADAMGDDAATDMLGSMRAGHSAAAAF
jgi:hypothetical protein